MNLPVLEELWKRTQQPASATAENSTPTWDKEIKTLYQLGISMEDTLQFLYFNNPDFETFSNWIQDRSRRQNKEEKALETEILSENDLDFWKKNGYVVIKNAIPKEDCIATQQAIWEFLEMRPEAQETWYKSHEAQKGLMLNFSDHETLSKNRSSAKIKKAYEQLYASTNIYKTIDKVSFSPPENQNFSFKGSALHWDTSLKQPLTFGLQGLLYLTDCGKEDGAFHCVSGFHNSIDNWLENLEPHENPREKALATLIPEAVTGNAGDFIIWDNRLPHCATPNRGKMPRMVQYLTYLPNNYDASGEWI